MANLRTGFSDLFFSEALPLLEDVIINQYADHPDLIPYIFNIKKSTRWGEQDTAITGFGAAVEKAENSAVTYDQNYQAYDKTYTHLTYALGLRTSKEMIDDDRFDIVTKGAKALAHSMFVTRQVIAAAHFNNGFSSAVGPDGKELFATDHPLVGGGTEQNELTTAADLSVTSLRQALVDINDTTDERGLPVFITPKYLLLPSELQFTGEELLKSTLRPDNAENAINAFKMKNLDWVMWQYLTDPDAWFIISDKNQHSLKFNDREPVNVSSDYDFDADASKTKIRCRFSSGWSEWRGVFGSPGI